MSPFAVCVWLCYVSQLHQEDDEEDDEGITGCRGARNYVHLAKAPSRSLVYTWALKRLL